MSPLTPKVTTLDYLIIIQARLGSTRLPNKVMQMVNGRTLLRRVWDAAKEFQTPGIKVKVAWPERYPDLDENNVLERFRRLSLEFPSLYIIRLTSDCPLLRSYDIWEAVRSFKKLSLPYFNNCRDGHDVQIFTREYLFDSRYTHKEHVIADFSTLSTGLSVNTREDLEKVRQICKTKQY